MSNKSGYIDKVKIVDIEYTVEYLDNACDVDIHKRKALWGQIDFWTRTIRIYNNGRPLEDVRQTLLHEILHGLDHHLQLDLDEEKDEERVIDLLATGLNLLIGSNPELFTTFKQNVVNQK